MQPKSVWEYIQLGINVGFLRCFAFHGYMREIDAGADWVVAPDYLASVFEELGLLGARGIARSLPPLGMDPEGLFFYSDILLPVLESESEKLQVFSPTSTRWDTQKLSNNVSALFAPNVFNSLHEVAQFDFSEAGKCIVFDLPTSAAFHMMRGTEMTLRQLYQSVTGKDSSKIYWKQIIEELKAKNQLPIPQTLYDHLDNIRENFRNPTQHPDKIYNLDEAQDLFGVCVDVVDQMIPLIWQEQNRKATS
ncbi:MAG: hypothetical protein HY741_00675 [Chloroflexi bacterium]|nr:hypothetical protein [Chloroflexota bacterium]